MLLFASVLSFSQKGGPLVNASNEVKSIRFYPNPASTTINFEFKDQVEKGTVLQVFNFLGRQVLTIPVSGSRVSVNVTDLIKGVYIFQVRTSNGRILETNKFQVSR
jgi:hypothetical protein